MSLIVFAMVAPRSRADSQPAPVREAGIDVVLDAGHGGSNSGSPGRGEIYEKRVTLALARQVRSRLESVGLRVAMTRSHDVYVPIRARARMANAMQPKCFVSIHTNASPDHSRHGVETYLLSRDAIDIRARRAAREASSDADAIVADLAVLDAARGSLRLAGLLQRQLVGGPALHPDGLLYRPTDRGVRQAAHDVLADAAVPAVLVEAGFLDHPTEGRLLATVEGQAQVADRIAAAIITFVRGPNGVVTGARAMAPVTLARLGDAR